MCDKCNKKSCGGCCETKVITKQGLQGKKGDTGLTGKKGDTGPMGAGIVLFIPVGTLLESTITDFDSPIVTEAGDYIVSLEANVQKVGGSDISFNSYIRKNGANDTLNTNYQHLNRTSGINCTHTHVGKISLLVGQTAGFELAMSASAKILNGSIILSKISR